MYFNLVWLDFNELNFAFYSVAPFQTGAEIIKQWNELKMHDIIVKTRKDLIYVPYCERIVLSSKFFHSNPPAVREEVCSKLFCSVIGFSPKGKRKMAHLFVETSWTQQRQSFCLV